MKEVFAIAFLITGFITLGAAFDHRWRHPEVVPDPDPPQVVVGERGDRIKIQERFDQIWPAQAAQNPPPIASTTALAAPPVPVEPPVATAVAPLVPDVVAKEVTPEYRNVCEKTHGRKVMLRHGHWKCVY